MSGATLSKLQVELLAEVERGGNSGFRWIDILPDDLAGIRACVKSQLQARDGLIAAKLVTVSHDVKGSAVLHQTEAGRDALAKAKDETV